MVSNILKHYPLSILCCIAIVILSLAPIGAPEMARDVPFFDKWAHFLMYGGQAFLVWWEMMHDKKKHSYQSYILYGVLLPILLGGLMELGQAYLTSYRSGEWMDLLADSVGAILGSGTAILSKRISI